jgi:hypothetical protein
VMFFNITGKPLLDISDDFPAYWAVEEIAQRVGLDKLR